MWSNVECSGCARKLRGKDRVAEKPHTELLLRFSTKKHFLWNTSADPLGTYDRLNFIAVNGGMSLEQRFDSMRTSGGVLHGVCYPKLSWNDRNVGRHKQLLRRCH